MQVAFGRRNLLLRILALMGGGGQPGGWVGWGVFIYLFCKAFCDAF